MMGDHSLPTSHELVHRCMFSLADALHHSLKHLPFADSERKRIFTLGKRIAKRCLATRRMIGAPASMIQGVEYLVDTFDDVYAGKHQCPGGPSSARSTAEAVKNVKLRNVCDNAQCSSFEGEDTPKMQKCAGCGVVRYCSPECQKVDWKAGHKAECKRMRD